MSNIMVNYKEIFEDDSFSWKMRLEIAGEEAKKQLKITMQEREMYRRIERTGIWAINYIK